MKIFTCCNWKLKFLGPIIDHWKSHGHEVQYTLGYDPAKHEWSDVCFIDVCDHNAIVGSRNRFPNSRLVIRAIDIECWVRQPRGVTWENVDAVIFGARHIQDFVESLLTFPSNVEVHHVPFGIDPSKWTYREHSPSSRIAFVALLWCAKGLPLLAQCMAKLGPSYELHVLGKKSNERWLHAYFDHIVSELNITVHHTDPVPSVDEWLEDKDYLFVTSQKEAFSYVAAEAAAKGIKPLIHNFYRAKDIWPESWVWSTIDELVVKFHSDYSSLAYRQFIEQNYTLEHMMEGINKACRIS